MTPRDDLPPVGLERRLPHFREGWRGAYLWHAVLLAAAIGLIIGALCGRFNQAPQPMGGPLIKSLRVACGVECSLLRLAMTCGRPSGDRPHFFGSAT